MKQIIVRSLIIGIVMSIPSIVQALRPTQRGQIATLMQQLEQSKVNAPDIWQRIQDIKISKNDYNDPEFQKLNSLAVQKLNAQGFTSNGQPLGYNVNLATMSQPSAPATRSVSTPTNPTQRPTALSNNQNNNDDSFRNRFNQPNTIEEKQTLRDNKQSQNQQQGQNNLNDEDNQLSRKRKKESFTQLRLKDLENIQHNLNNAKKFADLPELYKQLYTAWKNYVQDKNHLNNNEQEVFEEQADTLANLFIDKELSLRFAKNNLSNDDLVAIKTEFDDYNLLDFLNKKKINETQYRDLIKMRGDLIMVASRNKEVPFSLSSNEIQDILTRAQQPLINDYLGSFSNTYVKWLQNVLTHTKNTPNSIGTNASANSNLQNNTGQQNQTSGQNTPQNSNTANDQTPPVTPTNNAPQSQSTKLKQVLDELESLEYAAKGATKSDDLATIYQSFYKLQDRYAGLSGIPATEGKLWWKKTVTPSDKTQFAQASAKTLKALMEKDAKLGGNPITLTVDEVARLIQEINTGNLIDALNNKRITQDQYRTILNDQNALLIWKKQAERGTINTSDIGAIQGAITRVRSGGIYAQQPFFKKIANELEAYISNPTALKESKSLNNIKEQVATISADIATLNGQTNAIITSLTSSGTVAKNYGFKTKFGKIATAIQALPNGPEKEKLQKEAQAAFTLFGKYIGMSESTGTSAYSTLRQKWNNYWKKPDAETAVAIDNTKEAIQELISDYKAFPSYIYATETDEKTLLNDNFADPTQFQKILERTPKAQRLSVVETLILELRQKIFIVQSNLARNSIGSVPNFNRYKNLIFAALNGAEYVNGSLLGTPLLDKADSDKVKAAWNALQDMYFECLMEVLKQYRSVNDLSHLHEIATGETSKIAKDISELIPEAPFNAISQMIVDLDDYLKDNPDKRNTILDQVMENFCYILAAFDGFSYALVTGGVQPNKSTGWYSWFWGLFSYQLKANNKKDFQDKNTKYVREYLTKIGNAINLYETNILGKFANSQPYKLYLSNSLDILKQLNPDRSKAARLYKAGTNTYRYYAHVTSPLTLAGGMKIQAIIDDITALHKKSTPYSQITANYNTILTSAYEDTEWQTRAKADKIWQQIQNLAQKHDTEMNKIREKVIALKQKRQDAKTLAQITAVNTEMKEQEELWKNQSTALLTEYDNLLKGQEEATPSN